MRYPILDGFRGFFLLFMGIIHINRTTDVNIGKLNHHYFGWVEDAQGFIFISGFVVGLVYGGIYLKRSEHEMRKAIYRRMLTIYSHQASLIFIFLALATLFSIYGNVPTVLESYSENPVVFSLSSLALISGSLDMGILPIYIWFLAFTPLFMKLLKRNQGTSLIVVCATLWFIAQTGIMEVLSSYIEGLFKAGGIDLRIGYFFNIFAWQVIFFLGITSGFRLAEGKLDLSFLMGRQYIFAFYVGLFVFVLFGIWDRLIFDFWISRDFSQSFLEGNERQVLSLIYVLNFVLDLFLVTWIFVAGPSCGVLWIEKTALMLQWIFKQKFLVFLGQHSLHVFSFHLLLVYGVNIALSGRNIGEFWGSFILIFGAASLYIPAWLHAQKQRRDREKQLRVGTLVR